MARGARRAPAEGTPVGVARSHRGRGAGASPEGSSGRGERPEGGQDARRIASTVLQRGRETEGGPAAREPGQWAAAASQFDTGEGMATVAWMPARDRDLGDAEGRCGPVAGSREREEPGVHLMARSSAGSSFTAFLSDHGVRRVRVGGDRSCEWQLAGHTAAGLHFELILQRRRLWLYAHEPVVLGDETVRGWTALERDVVQVLCGQVQLAITTRAGDGLPGTAPRTFDSAALARKIQRQAAPVAAACADLGAEFALPPAVTTPPRAPAPRVVPRGRASGRLGRVHVAVGLAVATYLGIVFVNDRSGNNSATAAGPPVRVATAAAVPRSGPLRTGAGGAASQHVATRYPELAAPPVPTVTEVVAAAPLRTAPRRERRRSLSRQAAGASVLAAWEGARRGRRGATAGASVLGNQAATVYQAATAVIGEDYAAALVYYRALAQKQPEPYRDFAALAEARLRDICFDDGALDSSACDLLLQE
jgi:hypothetical protein